MIASQSEFSIRAKWIIDPGRPPIENGRVRLRAGRITAVESVSQPSQADNDLGECLLLPAPINAHTHLEFSDLADPLGQPRMPFPEWIQRVIACRSDRTRSDDVPAKTDAIQQGLQESQLGGVAAIGEIASQPTDLQDYAGTLIKGTIFLERLGLDCQQVAPTIDQLAAWLDRHAPGYKSFDNAWQIGLSPHAPYSVHWDLLVQLVEFAARRQLPIAMHLAESRDEIQLLQSGVGPFRELLEQLDVWDESAIPRQAAPLDYLKQLIRAPHALVIHGNYLQDSELDYLASHRDRFHVIYCPRTHRYFGHETYPLKQLHRRGIQVAIGTDSRASTPDLRVMRELAAIPDALGCSPQVKLDMATRCGAQALGLGTELGNIQPGKLAKFAILQLESNRLGRDPFEELQGNWERVLPFTPATHS